MKQEEAWKRDSARVRMFLLVIPARRHFSENIHDILDMDRSPYCYLEL
jgi:hypothetical protein